jgi:hypothetical protein
MIFWLGGVGGASQAVRALRLLDRSMVCGESQALYLLCFVKHTGAPPFGALTGVLPSGVLPPFR